MAMLVLKLNSSGGQANNKQHPLQHCLLGMRCGRRMHGLTLPLLELGKESTLLSIESKIKTEDVICSEQDFPLKLSDVIK